VSVDPFGDLVVTTRVVIPAEDLTWRFTGSGGPGGQHANTSNTRAEVSIDLDTCRGLPTVVRSRLKERHGAALAVASSRQRSQYQNRRDALSKLADLIRVGLDPPRRRVATRPTKGSQRRRLDAKSARSRTKATRRRPSSDDGY
jgi:ribosome-associated protein